MRQLGEGGMGVVWLAEQLATGRQVAVKFLRSRHGPWSRRDELARARFRREIELAARLDHPHIARVFDGGETEGVPYCVMEFIDGMPITEYAHTHTLGRRHRLALVQHVAEAVAHAHRLGVIHRDLKPSNILIDAAGEPHLLDFGLAKALETEESVGATLSLEGMVAGTPAYMSPEQAAGQLKLVDTRTDVYALGVLLYQLLTGRLPHDPDGPPDLVARRVADTEILRPRIADPDMGAELEMLLLKALAKRPTERYGGAQELADEIGRFLDGLPLEAGRASTWYFTRKWAKRRRWWLLGATSFLSVVSGAFFYHARSLREQTSRAIQGEHRAKVEEAKAREGLKEISRYDFANGQRMLALGKWQEAVACFGRAIRYDQHNGNARDALWLSLRYGTPDAGRLPALCAKHEGKVLVGSFSPDGTRFLTAGSDHAAHVWRVSDGKPACRPLTHGDDVGFACFSPDGRMVATASNDGTAQLWNAETGLPVGPPLKHEKPVAKICFNRDGTLVATASEDHTARLWNTATSMAVGPPLKHDPPREEDTGSVWRNLLPLANLLDPRLTIETVILSTTIAIGQGITLPLCPRKGVTDVVFSADGRLLCTASEGGVARIWKVPGSQSAPSLSQEPEKMIQAADLNSVRFSPDGKFLVTADATGCARIWDLSSGSPVGDPLLHDGAVFSACFSPDGTLVLTAGADKTARLWDAATGYPVSLPFGHNDQVLGAVFTDDGTRVVTACQDGTACVWNAASGERLGPPFDHGGQVVNAVPSPAGSQILTVGAYGRAYIWDMAIGQPSFLPGKRAGDAVVAKVEFSPDRSTAVMVAKDSTAMIQPVGSSRAASAVLKHQGTILDAAFSADGMRVITAAADKTARVWHAASGEQTCDPLQHSSAVKHACFSPNGAYAITCCGDENAYVWRFGSGQPSATLLSHDAKVLTVWCGPDSKHIITTCDDGRARLWDLENNRPVGSPMCHLANINHVAFSPDGRHVVTSSEDNTAILWNLADATQVGPPARHQNSVLCASFSADGKFFATSSTDNTARLWDAGSGLPIGQPMTHKETVERVFFSPDGTRLVTVCVDSTLQVWDRLSQLPVGPPLNAHPYADSPFVDILNSTYADNGRALIFADHRGTIGLWRVATGETLDSDLAEELTTCCSGALLDRNLGYLRKVPGAERLDRWRDLTTRLEALPAWRDSAMRWHERNPADRCLANEGLTVREASTILLSQGQSSGLHSVMSADPGNPLLPFACALDEAEQPGVHPRNPARISWLCDFGKEHLPRGTTRADQRIAADLTLKAATLIAKTMSKDNRASWSRHASNLVRLAEALAPEVAAQARDLRASLGGFPDGKSRPGL